MNREIKYRGLSLINNTWVFGFYNRSRLSCQFEKITSSDKILSGDDNLFVFPDTVGQFTGLKDKNGIEIYEGDIVKVKVEDGIFVKDFVGLVEFFEGAFYIIKEDKPFGYCRCPLYSKSYFIDIIGNIYENQELLNNNQIR